MKTSRLKTPTLKTSTLKTSTLKTSRLKTKTSISVFLLLLALLVTSQLVDQADAAPSSVVLSASFAGCSGNQALYDLSASIANGGTYSWSWGVTPISGPNDNPNYASVAVITFSKQVTVNVVNKMVSSQDSVVLSNPCISP